MLVSVRLAEIFFKISPGLLFRLCGKNGDKDHAHTEGAQTTYPRLLLATWPKALPLPQIHGANNYGDAPRHIIRRDATERGEQMQECFLLCRWMAPPCDMHHAVLDLQMGTGRTPFDPHRFSEDEFATENALRPNARISRAPLRQTAERYCPCLFTPDTRRTRLRRGKREPSDKPLA